MEYTRKFKLEIEVSDKFSQKDFLDLLKKENINVIEILDISEGDFSEFEEWNPISFQ